MNTRFQEAIEAELSRLKELTVRAETGMGVSYGDYAGILRARTMKQRGSKWFQGLALRILTLLL